MRNGVVQNCDFRVLDNALLRGATLEGFDSSSPAMAKRLCICRRKHTGSLESLEDIQLSGHSGVLMKEIVYVSEDVFSK
jgi:hypothetical protein